MLYGIGFLIEPFFINREFKQFRSIEGRLLRKRS